jgi:hypothetical protein
MQWHVCHDEPTSPDCIIALAVFDRLAPSDAAMPPTVMLVNCLVRRHKFKMNNALKLKQATNIF